MGSDFRISEENISRELDVSSLKLKFAPARTLTKGLDFNLYSKIPLVKSWVRETDDEFALRVYLESQSIINQFRELEPNKKGSVDFLHSFYSLYQNIDREGFLSDKSIFVLNREGVLINGMHRLAIAICKNLEVPYVESKLSRNTIINENTFLSKIRDSRIIAQLFWEKSQVEQSIIPVIVFSMNTPKKLNSISVSRGVLNPTWSWEIKLNFRQVVNLNIEMYQHEKWFKQQNNPSITIESRAKEIMQGSDSIVTSVMLIKSDNFEEVQSKKEEIRKLLDLGNYPVHSPVTAHENEYLLKVLLERDAHNFTFAKSRFFSFPTYKNLRRMDNFRNADDNTVINKNVIITGSTIIEAHNIRKARDFDIILINDSEMKIPEEVDCHNRENYVAGILDSIRKFGLEMSISNFVFCGYYFISLEHWRKILISRRDSKSRVDLLRMKRSARSHLLLMMYFVRGELYRAALNLSWNIWRIFRRFLGENTITKLRNIAKKKGII